MNRRHEVKYTITKSDYIVLRRRLGAVMYPDPHARGGSYTVRSLYFDDPRDRALREKLDGVSRREKFRLRYYGGDTSLIHLERKVKEANLGYKEVTEVTAEEVRRVLAGDVGWMAGDGRELLRQFYLRLRRDLLRPKVIVDYTREPFVFPAGNVRVTLDWDLRSGRDPSEFLDPKSLTLPAGDGLTVLEVKWDEFLPDMIRDMVCIPGVTVSAFSKYAQCRI